MKRILSLVLCAVMLLSCLAVLSACGNDKTEATKPTMPSATKPTTQPSESTQPDGPGAHEHVDANGDQLCDVCSAKLSYTYNTYLSSFPTMWNPHDYETSTEGEILGYIELGFYTFDFNEDRTGFAVVPEMATSMPIDVTADYVGEEWGIDEDETARAWKIVLRNDLRWQDGTPITANDFYESAKRLLDPKALNHRADSLYSGDLVIVGAKDYFYGGRTVTVSAASEYKAYSEDLDSVLVFNLGPGDVECYVRTWAGFPASYDVEKTANWLVANYGSYMDGPEFTGAMAAKMEGKTIAEIKADPELAAAWKSACGFANALSAAGPLVWCTTTMTCPETEWSTVGIRVLSDTEIVLILEDALDGFYLNYSLTGNLGLVHIPTYDACANVDENGLYSNSYCTTVENTMSYGPYKLTGFQLDKQIVLERNNQWYGYSDPAREGQYMTTRIVYDWINNPETAMEMFLQGKLDGKGLDSDNIAEYTGSDRIYYTDGASTWFVALNPDESFFSEWEEKNPGYDKSIMTMKEFRMALSFSLDRQNFINTLDPMGSIAYGLFNNMICSNPDLGVMYREEEAAKDVILDFWGIPQDAIGEGKYFADKDSAIESITGYDLEGAKNLFNQAYDKAVELGIYDGKETIQINIGTPNNTSKFYTRGYTFLVNCWTEAVKGTKLEGKLEFVNDSTLGDAFGDALRANTVDMLFGVGWKGAQLNPYGLIGAYTEDDYRYDKSWNTSAVMMDFTIADGTTLRASVLDWTYAISGDTIEARVIVNGEETDEVVEYSCGNADNKPEERILLLAALEGIVLANYDMIPTHNEASASLLGYQVEYGNQEYVYGVGRGGLQYMTYNYTDDEWVDYVASQGGILVYN